LELICKAKMAASKATKFMVVAVLVAMLLLMATELATALVLDGAASELKLGLYQSDIRR
jgi:hypothetical protein